jgi:hypothetical protein
MTGYQSKKAAAQAKKIDEVNWVDHEPDGKKSAQPAQEPVAWIQKDMECDDFDPDSVTCEKPTIAADGWEWVALFTHPPAAQPAQERNFCERCGKRTNDIHTCTPPQEKT